MQRRSILLSVAVQLAAAGLAFGDGNPLDGPAKAGSAAATPAEDGLFGKIPIVEAAALHAQTLENAPASVTVVTAAEIRMFGYRTLAEALAGVRGFYFTNDGQYDYAGVRGLAIPGDFNTEFLVMLNGHPLTENIYSSNNFFAQDFGLDMDLVERIEIIRGPSSALYGSNGMLANINVVTKSPVDVAKFRASTEIGSFGEKKVLLSSSLDLGKGANLLLSTSVFNETGRELYVPGNGTAHRFDAQKGYHTFANLVWGHWSFTGYFNSRVMYVPFASGGSIFDDQGTRLRDSRNSIGVNYSREVGQSSTLRWQLSYDQYRYDDRVDYPMDSGQIEDNRTGNWGDWVTSQLTYSFAVPQFGTTTVGVQGSFEVRSLQINRDVSPVPSTILNISDPDRSGAVFAQQELPLASHWTAYLGLRVDHSRNFGGFASPRLALVYRPSERTSYKLVYGRPFRNPSTYERYFDDSLYQVANPRLTRETAQVFEGSVERKLRNSVTAIVNAFDYRLGSVIQGVWTSDTLMQYQNAGAQRSSGMEFEAQTSPTSWLQADASFVVQKASEGVLGHGLPNSPSRIGKAKLAGPLVRNKLYLSGGFQYLSARATVTGALLRPVALADVTLSTKRLCRDFNLVFGIRNLFNWQYDQPVSLSIDRIRGDGRSFFLKAIWEPGDDSGH